VSDLYNYVLWREQMRSTPNDKTINPRINPNQANRDPRFCTNLHKFAQIFISRPMQKKSNGSALFVNFVSLLNLSGHLSRAPSVSVGVPAAIRPCHFLKKHTYESIRQHLTQRKGRVVNHSLRSLSCLLFKISSSRVLSQFVPRLEISENSCN
jgi:hypothetical protein